VILGEIGEEQPLPDARSPPVSGNRPYTGSLRSFVEHVVLARDLPFIIAAWVHGLSENETIRSGENKSDKKTSRFARSLPLWRFL
jgi:hypothetical protein